MHESLTGGRYDPAGEKLRRIIDTTCCDFHRPILYFFNIKGSLVIKSSHLSIHKYYNCCFIPGLTEPQVFSVKTTVTVVRATEGTRDFAVMWPPACLFLHYLWADSMHKRSAAVRWWTSWPIKFTAFESISLRSLRSNYWPQQRDGIRVVPG